MKRRNFIKAAALSGLTVGSFPALAMNLKTSKEKVRIGFIGVGLRGTNHLRNILQRDDVIVPAVCDIDESRNEIAGEMITGAGHPKPEIYSENEYAFEKLQFVL